MFKIGIIGALMIASSTFGQSQSRAPRSAQCATALQPGNEMRKQYASGDTVTLKDGTILTIRADLTYPDGLANDEAVKRVKGDLVVITLDFSGNGDRQFPILYALSRNVEESDITLSVGRQKIIPFLITSADPKQGGAPSVFGMDKLLRGDDGRMYHFAGNLKYLSFLFDVPKEASRYKKQASLSLKVGDSLNSLLVNIGG